MALKRGDFACYGLLQLLFNLRGLSKKNVCVGNVCKYLCCNDAILIHLHLDSWWIYLILDFFSQHIFGNTDSVIFEI